MVAQDGGGTKGGGGARYGTVTVSGWTGDTFVSKVTILGCRMTLRPIAGSRLHMTLYLPHNGRQGVVTTSLVSLKLIKFTNVPS